MGRNLLLGSCILWKRVLIVFYDGSIWVHCLDLINISYLYNNSNKIIDYSLNYYCIGDIISNLTVMTEKQPLWALRTKALQRLSVFRQMLYISRIFFGISYQLPDPSGP